MILTIKVKDSKQLPDGCLQLTTDCESLREALQEHSPNILVDYLNERYGTKIERINYNRKEAKVCKQI